MKYLALAFVGLLWLILTVPDANAVVCARGYYRAGCVSRYGAVGVGPGDAVAIGRYGHVYRVSRCIGATAEKFAAGRLSLSSFELTRLSDDDRTVGGQDGFVR